jgi:hypothetical protein
LNDKAVFHYKMVTFMEEKSHRSKFFYIDQIQIILPGLGFAEHIVVINLQLIYQHDQVFS